MTLKTFDEAQNYLHSFIPQNLNHLHKGEAGLDHIKSLLSKLGNPQNSYKAIHIAGTSGKGSTAVGTATILVAHNFKTGLMLSPHILDIRERFQINKKLISESDFVKYINKLKSVLDYKNNLNTCFTFFELVTVLGFLIFAEESVDYAVIETGLGGLLDATNTISSENKISVITELGLDHTNILGNTLSEIAFQKAGIIQPKNIVFSAWQKSEARIQIQNAIQKNEANLHYVISKQDFDENCSNSDFQAIWYSNVKVSKNATSFSFEWNKIVFTEIKTSLLGYFQALNTSLALSVCLYLGKRDNWEFDEKTTRESLQKISISGRFQVLKVAENEFVLDMAHNGQKVEKTIQLIQALYPNSKLKFIVSIMKSKNATEILEKIYPIASEIILTEFSSTNPDTVYKSHETKDLALILSNFNFKNYLEIPNVQDAVNHVLDHNLDQKNTLNVVIGSAYLVGEVLHFL